MTGCITAWYGNSTALNRMALQKVVPSTSQYITGAELPAIQDLYTRQCEKKARKIIRDTNHPSHRLFSLLPHGKWYQCIKSDTNRLFNSFYPQEIRLINRQQNSYTNQVYLVSLLTFYFTICTVSMHTHRSLHTTHTNTPTCIQTFTP